jgi:TRAP-type transport system small permease protein
MRHLAKAEDIALGAILWSLFLIVGLQFFTRYVLNNSLGWTEEIARMMLILLTYAGAVVCAREREHIQVDLIIDILPDRAKAVLNRLYDLIGAVFFAFLAWTAAKFAMSTRLMMSSIEIPKSLIFWVCAVALALIALRYAMHLFHPAPE